MRDASGTCRRPEAFCSTKRLAVSSSTYCPYGAMRGGSDVATDYRYTGQRWQDQLGLYYYRASLVGEWPLAIRLTKGHSPFVDDPAMRRFVQADTIVPQPGNPQTLNRYAYGLNNPVKYNDPGGHAAEAVAGGTNWLDQWYWKNRWYNAHGFSWSNDTGYWSVLSKPVFSDDAIMDEVIDEAGVSLLAWGGARWTTSAKYAVAFGVATFGQRFCEGIVRLKELLGGGATIVLGGIGRSGMALPFEGNVVRLPNLTTNDAEFSAQWVVHELAHVIDWQSGKPGSRYSDTWSDVAITDYAATALSPRRWERFAEAVTAWVFRDFDGDLYDTTYYGANRYKETYRGPDYYDQMALLTALFKGSGR